MCERVIRVGITGQGRSGYTIHARWLRMVQEQFRIVALANRLAERRAQERKELGCRAYCDYGAMIRAGGFDLFVNALFSRWHSEGTIAALEAGHHVVCEKPAAVRVVDFDRIVRTARIAGRRLFAFQNSRYQPAFHKIQEVLRSGKLGDLIQAHFSYRAFARRWGWQTRQELWGGI